MDSGIDLGVIIDAIVAFDHEDYGIGINPARDARGEVSEWAIDLAIEIADALEPGGAHTASVPRVPACITEAFVHGRKESYGAQEAQPLVDTAWD